ncbi:DUF4265 domain-containing protein [Phytoactinopolyspora alkaliphila]|uniref:DUF4265 domain-containing protein n=1 Tax=Phytoactinopolyspora alkaliphila TaxID=1783498 RepID=A0A6N9YQ43_9ACTN|nr:DUF4265 domain-containing protein [Phytoactinopolyspora alkaliphila]
MTESNVVVHPEPTWRDRSDFIISADLSEKGRSEQLWARQLADYRFEVCRIPFFMYDVALGDIVETDESYDMTKVIKSSVHSVFRVWFGNSGYPRQDIADTANMRRGDRMVCCEPLSCRCCGC